MLKWKKVGENASAEGLHVITYQADGCRYLIQSRRRPIPHANGRGSWLHTTYFLVDPGTCEEREFWRLSRAKAAAELECAVC